MAGTWNSLTNQPTFNAGTMLLLTDGSVLCHDEPNSGPVTGTKHWWRLVPDSMGSYRNGTWHQVADSSWAPLYFACTLLRDGLVFIAGGEYDGTGKQKARREQEQRWTVANRDLGHAEGRPPDQAEGCDQDRHWQAGRWPGLIGVGEG